MRLTLGSHKDERYFLDVTELCHLGKVVVNSTENGQPDSQYCEELTIKNDHLFSNVPDSDPYVLWPPGSGSVIYFYGSGSFH